MREAEDKEPVEPGTVYFAPPDYHLLVDAGPQLALSADEPCTSRGRRSTCCSSRRPTSTATALLGIILTGASDDGAAGLAAVHRAGGVTVVQRAGHRAGAAHGRVGAASAAPVDMVLSLERDRRPAARR